MQLTSQALPAPKRPWACTPSSPRPSVEAASPTQVPRHAGWGECTTASLIHGLPGVLVFRLPGNGNVPVPDRTLPEGRGSLGPPRHTVSLTDVQRDGCYRTSFPSRFRIDNPFSSPKGEKLQGDSSFTFTNEVLSIDHDRQKPGS